MLKKVSLKFSNIKSTELLNLFIQILINQIYKLKIQQNIIYINVQRFALNPTYYEQLEQDFCGFLVNDYIWFDGTWENGTWTNGFWRAGTWNGGMIFSTKYNTYVFSISPPTNVTNQGFYYYEALSSSLQKLVSWVSIPNPV